MLNNELYDAYNTANHLWNPNFGTLKNSFTKYEFKENITPITGQKFQWMDLGYGVQ